MENKEDISIQLKDPIQASNLTSEKGFTFEVNFDDLEAENNVDIYDDDLVEEFDFGCDLNDDDTYDCNPIPFDELDPLMTSLDESGFVKKRTLRKGKGEKIPPKSLVYFNYNAYQDSCPEPYDTTLLHQRSFSARLGSGGLIDGLDLGILSMVPMEKAQFLIKPEMAYGEWGCPPMIPPKCSILFEVEVIRYVDCVVADKLEDDKEKQKTDFDAMHSAAEALCFSGNELCQCKKNHKAAIYAYNQAISKLQNVNLKDYPQELKRDQLLIRLHTNLAVCYMKIDKPKKCCNSCNEVFRMTKCHRLPVKAKVFYNNAKALLSLGDLKRAEMMLRRAADIHQHNEEIVRLYLQLNKQKEVSFNQEKKIGEALVSSSEEKNKEAKNDES